MLPMKNHGATYWNVQTEATIQELPLILGEGFGNTIRESTKNLIHISGVLYDWFISVSTNVFQLHFSMKKNQKTLKSCKKISYRFTRKTIKTTKK
jgi:hypothetical protein